MKEYGIITLMYLSVLLTKNTAEVFSAVSKLELLITTQKNIIDRLHNYLNNSKVPNTSLENCLRRLTLEHREAMLNVPKYLSNPVNSFRLIKRLTVDFMFIEDMINESDFKRNESLTYPTRVDLTGSAEGLLRLEKMYGLDINNIASGFWNTSYGNTGTFVKTFNPMTISDCFELGKALYEINYYNDGIKWLKIALRKFNDERILYPEDDRITLGDINKEITNGYKSDSFMVKKFNTWYKAIAVRLPNIATFNPEVVVYCFKKGLKPVEAIKKILTEHRSVSSLSVTVTDKMDDLCKGTIRRNTINKDMKCYLAHGPHPFLKLAPIKAETLHSTPVTLFYDVIHESEIEHIKNLVLPTLDRAYIGYKRDIASIRVSQAGKACSNDKVASRVRMRIEHFSGMKLDHSEALHVANYGIAGHYSAHYDYWCNDTYSAKNGNRIATGLLYLSAIEQGGATVFPRLGLSVFPVKGAALFWLNLLTSGEGNALTYHAACPVLWGSKWVVTQWINQRGQELSMPCRSDKIK